MSLSDYAVKRDHFDMPTDGPVGINAELAFPCCCCSHQNKTDSQPPCSTCDHNTNAVKEPPAPKPNHTPEQQCLMEIASHAADLNPGDPIILTLRQITTLRCRDLTAIYNAGDRLFGIPGEYYHGHPIELSSAPEDAP